jgi:hypothetical protein
MVATVITHTYKTATNSKTQEELLMAKRAVKYRIATPELRKAMNDRDEQLEEIAETINSVRHRLLLIHDIANLSDRNEAHDHRMCGTITMLVDQCEDLLVNDSHLSYAATERYGTS